MPFTHNSKVAESEPSWGNVDKTKLPLKAFVWEAPDTDDEKVSTWRFPHHFVADGGDPDDNGRDTTGTLYLHEGGLAAASAAAKGARSGEEAPPEVFTHLNKHREALGQEPLERGKTQRPKTVEKGVKRVALWGESDQRLHATPLIGKRANDTGELEGYAAVFDNIDLGGEVIRKGTFKESAKVRVPKGKVKLMVRHFAHGGDVPELIGTWTEAEEDDFGLRFKARFSSDQLAQDTRRKIAEGHVDTLSVGFGPIAYGWKTQCADCGELYPEGDSNCPGCKSDRGGTMVLEHTEAKLYEATVTAIPMNEEAEIIAAKTLDLEGRLRDMGALEEVRSSTLSAKRRAELMRELFGDGADAIARAKTMRDSAGSVASLVEAILPEPEVTSAKTGADLSEARIAIARAKVRILEVT